MNGIMNENINNIINNITVKISSYDYKLPIRIYHKSKNQLININKANKINKSNKANIKIKRLYNNLIQIIEKTNNSIIKIETYTEKYTLIYEDINFIVFEYNKKIQENNTFPNLKVYDNEIEIENIEYEITPGIYLKNEDVTFIEAHHKLFN